MLPGLGVGLELFARDQVADGEDTGIRRQGYRLLAAELEAVVLFRVMRCRDHHAGRISIMTNREIELVGRGESQVDDAGALRRDAAGERLEQRLRTRAHVAPDRDRLGAQKIDERPPYPFGDAFVQLAWIDATDIVALEDIKIDGCVHGSLVRGVEGGEVVQPDDEGDNRCEHDEKSPQLWRLWRLLPFAERHTGGFGPNVATDLSVRAA